MIDYLKRVLKPASPINKFWHGVKYNDADKLDVIIIPTVIHDRPYAEAVVVHLLTAEENNFGNHNLFLDVIDEQGNQIRGALLRGDNNGIKLEARVDKPSNEFGTNFAMYSQDTVSCWVEEVPGFGKVASDVVSGFHTRWGGDKVGGQNYGHVSFYTIFCIRKGGIQPPVITPPTEGEYERGFAAGHAKGFALGRSTLKGQIQDLLNRL